MYQTLKQWGEKYNMKKLILILFLGSCFAFQSYAENIVEEIDVNGKTKAEWKELYTQAGCYDLNIFAREICKTKVFQLENYKNVKEGITKIAQKLNNN
jgi:hypothetical protein